MKRFATWTMLPGAGLAVVAAVFAGTAPSSSRALNVALAAVGVMLVWSVAVAVRARYPERRLWLLLGLLAVAYAVHPLIFSSHPVLYALGRAARPGTEVLLIWVMLAFPTGRLNGWHERFLVGGGVVITLCLWLPGVMLSPRIPSFAPLVVCTVNCPENLFFVADRPELSLALLKAFRILGAILLLATSLHLARRLLRATPLMRRSLYPILLASIARTLSMAVFLSTGAGLLVLTFTFWAVPLAIALGLLLGRLYTAKALHRLVTGLRRRPGLGELRNVMADALDDRSLELGVWDAGRQAWMDAGQREIILPASGSEERTARLLCDAEAQPVAIIVHDSALLEEPMLLEAVTSSMMGALASLKMESALIAERANSATSAEAERRRIERDLHDGAQQRLLALRMKIGVARRLAENDPKRAGVLLAEMGKDADAAIAELRALAHGIVPPLLGERGLAAALAEVADCAALPVNCDLMDIGRCDPAIERAIYFCCVEALQNAAKHAGPGAMARLTLNVSADALTFSVTDSGGGSGLCSGFEGGLGMTSMRERVAALGGALEVCCAAGGVSVTGRIPLYRNA